jgi:putative redox protein
MKSEVSIKWQGNMSFETEISGHKITIDAGPEVGGENKGPRPKPFVLLA